MVILWISCGYSGLLRWPARCDLQCVHGLDSAKRINDLCGEVQPAPPGPLALLLLLLLEYTWCMTSCTVCTLLLLLWILGSGLLLLLLYYYRVLDRCCCCCCVCCCLLLLLVGDRSVPCALRSRGEVRSRVGSRSRCAASCCPFFWHLFWLTRGEVCAIVCV